MYPLSSISSPTSGNALSKLTLLQSTVGINSWVAHQNPEVYGQDAYQFRPERWLEEESHNKNFEAYFFAVSATPRIIHCTQLTVDAF